MGELRLMNKRGDTRVMWDPYRQDEVAAARKQFDELKKKGYLAYAVKKKGEAGEQIREFDPHAGKIIMAPPMAGG
jgi:hypothetical protein